MRFATPRGTKDILPEEIPLWNQVEATCRRQLELYGFREIRTPVFEDSALFIRSLGRASDIVSKQMLYVSSAGQEERYSLRPEATAAIVRAYLEHHLDKKGGFVKLFYIGPMFRGERPQKGRLRQFHHIGVEAIGITCPWLDAEIIALAVAILRELGISGFELKINSLGCEKDKARLAQVLKDSLKDKLSEFCVDCQARFDKNIFRLLDCKEDSCRKLVARLSLTDKYLCPECRDYFKAVQDKLRLIKIPFTVSNTLVRGLDYYTHTVFEISHPDLGAQDALGAGGRYDNLVRELGGEAAGAMGFAFGFERLLLALPKAKPQPLPTTVFIACLGEPAMHSGFLLLNDLRKNGIASAMAYATLSFKSQLRQANDLNAKLVVLIGDEEIEKKYFTVKDMATGNQEKLAAPIIVEEIRKRLTQ
ncbi:MAG: histidine--tRNA ligase [Candidatus Omnitrophota bacterium]